MAQMGKDGTQLPSSCASVILSPACTQKGESGKEPQIVCSQLTPSLIHHAMAALLC